MFGLANYFTFRFCFSPPHEIEEERNLLSLRSFPKPSYLNVRNSQLKACQEAALVPSLLGAAEVGQPQPR